VSATEVQARDTPAGKERGTGHAKENLGALRIGPRHEIVALAFGGPPELELFRAVLSPGVFVEGTEYIASGDRRDSYCITPDPECDMAFGPPMETKVATGDVMNDLTRDDCRGTACRTLLPSTGADPGYGSRTPTALQSLHTSRERGIVKNRGPAVGG